jgi:predicted DNA-binding transcriptional regulator AlpA
MENPFETINQRLSNIESLLLSIKNPEVSKPPEPETEKPLTQPEAIEFLGKSRQTLNKWRKAGRIKGRKLGGRIYFMRSELIAAMQ